MHGGIDIPGVELLDELGRGAHGAVYRARRGAEYYAVKVALAASDPSAFVRFQREAIALARAKHPGLPRVLDVAKSGAPYLVMELVEGETLAARLARGTLSEEETRSLGLQLADVLAHIHRLGLVHRDVKPRNIIFDEKTGRARIVDFGIAIGTASNNFAAEGTVPYAAPEQLRGLSVDGRADLYSLGCVLYECLCGIPPLGPLSLSRLGKADPLSDEAGLQRSAASPELGRVIARLTSQEASARFSDADKVVQALRAVSRQAEYSELPPLRRLHHGALVGREREIEFLARSWSEVRSGNSRVIAIEGAMGSGKTALLQAFCDQVRTEGKTALYVPCVSFDPTPFSVVRRIFDAFLSELGEERFKLAAVGFEALLPIISPALCQIFRDPPAIPDSDDAHHFVLESAARFLGRLLTHEGLVTLCVDDFQWIDAGSSAIVRKALSAGGLPSLVLLGNRNDSSGSSELDALRASSHERIATVSLAAFEDEAIVALLRAYLGCSEVPEEIVRRVAALSTPTPLGALEALRTLLEGRAILPDWAGWRLQPEAAEAVHLPDSAIEMVRARIWKLDADVPEVLVGAAAVGMDFDVEVLAEITELSRETLSAALREACRASLVIGGPLNYRFVHQAVREALLASCTEGKLRDLNGRAAYALDQELLAESGSDGSELVYRVADLYWRSEWRYAPERAIEVIETAAQRAFEAFDNRQALLFMERALEIRDAIARPAPGPILHLHGELLTRLGNLADGRALLERSLTLAHDKLQRATILARIAWICEWELDSGKAWDTLRRAFAELDADLPTSTPSSIVRSGGAWLRSAFGRVRPVPDGNADAVRRQKILCALYYRTFRTGLLSANAPQTIQAAVLGLEASQALGVSTLLSRAYLAYSLVLAALGQRERGRSYLKQGDDIALATGDPAAIAHAKQLHSIIACWEGNIGEGLDVGARCIKEHGHWLDFSEHCHLAYNQSLLERVRGRGYEELNWVEHILRQVELNGEAYGMFEFIELGAHGLLVHLGRKQDADRLLARLREVTVKIPRSSSYYVFSFGPRARALADEGEFGRELDALDVEFRHGGHDPKRVHLGAAEYYVHLAHARVHACIRAEKSELSGRVEQLARAANDLRLAARIPLLKAHSLVVDAYLALFGADDEKCGKRFAEADALAIEEDAPWVRYAVARGRAHRYAKRNIDVARNEARRAEQIAREHGAVHRLRWIREEFELPQTSAVFSVPGAERQTREQKTTSSFGTNRELRRDRIRSGVLRARERPVEPRERRRLFLDELTAGLSASEVHWFSSHADGQLDWVSGRNSLGSDVGPPPVQEFLREVATKRLGALVDDTAALRSRLAVPVVDTLNAGVIVYAEAPGCGVFDARDCDVVSESVARFLKRSLLSGPANDRQDAGAFPYQRSASEFARALAEHFEHLADEGEPGSEGSILTRVTTASRLLHETARLERHQPALVNLNEVVGRGIQKLRSSKAFELLTDLESALGPVYIDPAHIELLLLHCSVGARRRMRGRGTFVIETANVQLEEPFLPGLENPRRGGHTMLTIAGIPECESEARASAPSTGFGDLADQVVRDIAFANDATYALRIEPAGANLQLFFRCSAGPFEPEQVRSLSGAETVLVVDRDAGLQSALSTELRQLGYRVLLATDRATASNVVDIHGGRIDVALLDVGLDDVRGWRWLAELVSGPIVYASHYPWNAFRAAGIAVPRAQFLQKPFARVALSTKIRALCDEPLSTLARQESG
jgi:serine/threonine protein kinase/CheY-like chemotaxis protein